MELNPQILKNGKRNEFVVLKYSEFLKVKTIIDDYEDIVELRKAKSIDKSNQGKRIEDLILEY